MPGFLAIALTDAEWTTVGLAVLLAILIAWIGVRAWRRSRLTPAERERRRRHRLVSTGKMGDANLLEIRDNLLLYSYDVRGVGYTASQDISELRHALPADLSATAGVILVKYDASNPADSIVLAEARSGLRGSPPQP